MSALHPDLQLCPRFCFFAPLNISWIAYSLTHAWQTKRKEVATRAFVSYKTGFQTVLLDSLPFRRIKNSITSMSLDFFFKYLKIFLKGNKIISINIIDRNQSDIESEHFLSKEVLDFYLFIFLFEIIKNITTENRIHFDLKWN